MTQRVQFRTVVTLLACSVLLRALPFLWWPSLDFNSEQATVGLMARHISEGRALPLYYYGQTYLLAAEAYAAAPFMWAAGATVAALKLPLVVVNLAVVFVLLRLLVRDGALSPWAATIAALPIAMPAASIAALTTEASGGNVEPWLYALLLWILRARPFAFGTLLGIGMLHRGVTGYAAAAVFLMDAVGLFSAPARNDYLAQRARHWALVGIGWVAAIALASILQPFASAWGPGTRGDDSHTWPAEGAGARVCIAPENWADRSHLLFAEHLPRLVGGAKTLISDYGVSSGLHSGQAGLSALVGIVTIAGLVAGTWFWWSRRSTPEVTAIPHIGGYLLLVGLISTAAYGYASCGPIGVETLRNNLLGLFVPVGALVMALQAWRLATARVALAAATALWCGFNARDIVSLIAEHRTHPPIDQRRLLAEELVGRGITSAWAPATLASHVTFLAGERVRVAASDVNRIRIYAEEATRTSAPTISDVPCRPGTALASGGYLCPEGTADGGRGAVHTISPVSGSQASRGAKP